MDLHVRLQFHDFYKGRIQTESGRRDFEGLCSLCFALPGQCDTGCVVLDECCDDVCETCGFGCPDPPPPSPPPFPPLPPGLIKASGVWAILSLYDLDTYVCVYVQITRSAIQVKESAPRSDARAMASLSLSPRRTSASVSCLPTSRLSLSASLFMKYKGKRKRESIG